MFTSDSWINPPHYYKIYSKYCNICGDEFETNDDEEEICLYCEEDLDKQICLIEDILESLNQLDYKVEYQKEFTKHLIILMEDLISN